MAPSLLARAREEGSVRVVVTLAVPGYEPEAGLPPADVTRQRADIAALQQRLAKELAPSGARVVTRHERLPVMTLTAGEAGLQLLASSSLVASVDADAPERTTQ